MVYFLKLDRRDLILFLSRVMFVAFKDDIMKKGHPFE